MARGGAGLSRVPAEGRDGGGGRVLYWLLKRIILGPALHALFRPWVKGLENVPEQGAAILASNHLSFSDSFFLPVVLDRKVTFIAKAEYFTTPGVKGRLTAAYVELHYKGTGEYANKRNEGGLTATVEFRIRERNGKVVSLEHAIQEQSGHGEGVTMMVDRAQKAIRAKMEQRIR